MGFLSEKLEEPMSASEKEIKSGTTLHNLKPELLLLWKYRLRLMLITLIAGSLAFIYASFKRPEYLSTAELTPPSLKYIKSLNFTKSIYQGFGTADDEDLERVVAALKSDTAFIYICQKFSLSSHYGVGKIELPLPDSKELPEGIGSKMKALREIYDDKISVKVTGFSTVQINVFDHDPKMAANIANEMVAYAQRFVENIARRKEGIVELQKTIHNFQERLKILQDSVAYLRKNYRLYHLDNMSEVISAQVSPQFIQPKFSEKYDQLLSAEHRMRFLDDNIISMQNELSFREENLKTYPFLVDIIGKGFPSYVKARPKRLPYLLVSSLFAFVLASLGIIYRYSEKK